MTKQQARDHALAAIYELVMIDRLDDQESAEASEAGFAKPEMRARRRDKYNSKRAHVRTVAQILRTECPD